MKIITNSKPTETFENTTKERTALSILYGLRIKFGREMRKDKKVYTSNELYQMFSELMNKINKNELEVYQRKDCIVNDSTNDDPIWGVIDEAVSKSKIKRYNWKALLGDSLTEIILTNKKSGNSPEKCLTKILNSEKIQLFIKQNPSEKNNIIKNIKISIYARYGESDTEMKVFNST